jgi:hypothetical protein
MLAASSRSIALSSLSSDDARRRADTGIRGKEKATKGDEVTEEEELTQEEDANLPC